MSKALPHRPQCFLSSPTLAACNAATRYSPGGSANAAFTRLYSWYRCSNARSLGSPRLNN
jgi:hypothetical protein